MFKICIFRYDGCHFYDKFSFLCAILFRIFLFLFLNFIYICKCGDTLSNVDYSKSGRKNLDENSLFSKPRRLFTNEFVVHFLYNNNDKSHAAVLADDLARKYGFLNKGPILDDDIFIFALPQRAKRSTRPIKRYDDVLRRLRKERVIKEIDQIVIKRRVKRDFVNSKLPSAGLSLGKCALSLCKNSTINQNVYPNDPEWRNMWYLGDQFNHNIKEAWSLGITGKDVVVTILDDGLEITHPDIKQNYDPRASYDVNDNDNDPTPKYLGPTDNKHGTRCAGEVAAVYNNSMCIVGVAYGARIGGIRMLDGDVSDVTEAASLSHNRQHVDIYSASWGPDDDGKSLDGPAKLATLAFKLGVEQGRGGLGSIFVWASGNGGVYMDNCNCDGYTNSIYTLSISSASERGLVPYYSEACSSTMAATYSSGAPDERQIVTTDVHHTCTSSHTGTSASAPLAAGICALALEANRNLTWRDMQHIVVRTAQRRSLYAADWRTNGVGREVSHSFGYGLMDAAAMVKLARKWTGCGEQKMCTLSSRKFLSIKEMSIVEQTMNVNQSDYCWAATGQVSTNVFFLEHVQARLTLNTTGKRGDLQIFLTSPAGTKSTLLSKRANDFERKGFSNWPFMSVHMWGERVFGKWKLEIQNDARESATLIRWDLVFYGTSEEIGPTGLISNRIPNAADQVLKSADHNLGCCGYSPLNLCLACKPGHILFQGRCLDQCPVQYRMINNSECETAAYCAPCPGYCNTCTETCTSKLCIQGFEYNENLEICEKSNLRNIKDPARRIFNHYNLFKSHKVKNITLWNNFSVGIICLLVLAVLALFVVLKYFKKNVAIEADPGTTPTVRPVKKNRARILWQNWIVKKPAAAGTEFAMQTIPTTLQHTNC